VIAYSWLAALAVVGVLNLLHANLHEHRDLPQVVHWLRDAALAVPLAAGAVIAAALVVRARAAGREPAAGSSFGPRIGWAVLAALLFALLCVPGIQVHGFVFGAGEPAVGLVEHALTEGTIALQVSLAVLIPAALVLGPPWAISKNRPAANDRPVPTGRSAASTPTALAATHTGGDR
jgi:hypothetical protein